MSGAAAPFPHRAQDVTVEWIRSVLERNGIDAAGLASLEWTPIGVGQIGENARITLHWTDRVAPGDGVPGTLVAKFASADPTSRATGATTQLYRREVRFYREVAPRTSARTARCYAAEIDDEEFFVLLLEDLHPGVVGDQMRGCSLAEAEVGIDVAADLHASWWASEELASLGTWLATAGDPTRAAGVAQLWTIAWPEFVRRHPRDLDDDQRALAERFASSMEAWSTRPRGDLTVVHGDYRVDNMLFGTEPDPWVVAVDWQTVAIGQGVADIAYFLGASLLPADRAANEERLVRRWFDRVGAAGYTWADCWTDYRLSAFDGFVTAVVATLITKQTERGDQMFLTMADRHLRAALELDAASLLP